MSNIVEQVTTTVQSFIVKWLCKSLKFQLRKKISSLNLNRLTLIRFLDVREVRDRLFISGACVCVRVCVWGGGGGGESRVLVQIESRSYFFVQLKTRGCTKFCKHF